MATKQAEDINTLCVPCDSLSHPVWVAVVTPCSLPTKVGEIKPGFCNPRQAQEWHCPLWCQQKAYLSVFWSITSKHARSEQKIKRSFRNVKISMLRQKFQTVAGLFYQEPLAHRVSPKPRRAAVHLQVRALHLAFQRPKTYLICKGTLLGLADPVSADTGHGVVSAFFYIRALRWKRTQNGMV